MLFGAHVRQAGGLEAAPTRGEARGLEVVQVFTQSPRRWAPTSRDAGVLAALAARQRASPVVQAWVCHATYLINLASPDRAVWERSRDCLTENLRVASGIGAIGLVVHVGSGLGASLADRLPGIAEAIVYALDAVPDGCPLLLENAAGAGGTVGRTIDELATVIDALDGDERVGVCLDSQHLWASGIPFDTPELMDALLTSLDRAVGVERLRCLHLNDSVVPFGANRDRHANLGEGTIGDAPLAAFLGHPAVQHLPVVMEFEGYGGDGPPRRTSRWLGASMPKACGPTPDSCQRQPPTPPRWPEKQASYLGEAELPLRSGPQSERQKGPYCPRRSLSVGTSGC